MGPSGESAAAAFRTGSLVGGQLRIEAEIAHGGAGAVYRVLDVRNGRRLALKRLQWTQGAHDALLAAQFQREYHTLCQLAHPRIIDVYDYGVEAGSPYYTMELLDGEDLHERGKLPWRTACALLRDVASSLAILHSRRLIHRDLSSRNVRCTADGRAKLIDFGAMAPIGSVRQVVGTPPFVPPEAVQLQALDARADLYALGALAYFTLTGRYAHPARALGQLRELWRTTPPSPKQLEPELPPALDQLVMELLSLERSARPRSAAEVMERLSGIAGLPLGEHDEVGQAYLVMPSLIGRDAPLARVRAALLRAQGGPGASFLVTGRPGMGRSRFLEACVLEAKLQAMTVLRGDASDSTHGDYGLIRTLCEQMLTALPQLAEQSARPRRSLLARVLPQLAGRRIEEVTERRHLQAALRDWMLAVVRAKPLLIAVDNVDAVDEPSAALLGMLSHAASRRQLVLVLTTTDATASSAALALQRDASQAIELGPLDVAQTEALLRSVFGDVDHLAPLAARIHVLSEGSPHWTMELCERLCERGIARYEAGSWRLPRELGNDALPDSLTAEFAARVAALPQDARELCQVLCLTEVSALPLQIYPALTSHGDAARTHAALAALEQSRILGENAERYRFSRPELCALLRAEMPAEQAGALHLRIAAVAPQCDDPMLLPHHLMLAGEQRTALERLLALRQDAAATPFVLELLARALPLAQQLSLPRHMQIELQHWLCELAARLGDRASFLGHAGALLERLCIDSGLSDYQALDPALAPAQRLAEASAIAVRRHDEAAAEQRGFPLDRSRQLLVRLYFWFTQMASFGAERSLLEHLPSLSPLAPRSPLFETVQRMVAVELDIQAARFAPARAGALALAERLRAPDRGGFRPADAKSVRLMLFCTQGIFAAALGAPVAPELMAELEREPSVRAYAWRIRMLSEFTQGNLESGLAYQRRAELMQLQDGGRLTVSTARTELRLHIALDDLLGIKRTIERLEPVAARYPGWQPSLAIARSHYHRLQGDLEAAGAALAPALEQTPLGKHIDSSLAVGTQLCLLNALGRHDEAVRIGRPYVAQADAAQVAYPTLLPPAYAEALARSGECDEAVRTLDRSIAELTAAAARGLYLGLAYEARARVAIVARDEAGLRHYAGLCAREFRRGSNPLMGARHERLLREAAAAGLELQSEPTSRTESVDRLRATLMAETVYGRMLTCIGPQERAQEGLRILVDATGAATGHLFGLRAGQLRLLSSIEQVDDSSDLVATLETYLQRELEAESESTRAEEGGMSQQFQLQRWVDAWGREFEPMLLYGKHDGENVIAAVAALHYETDERPVLQRGVLDALSQGLLAADLIDPVTCVT